MNVTSLHAHATTRWDRYITWRHTGLTAGQARICMGLSMRTAARYATRYAVARRALGHRP